MKTLNTLSNEKARLRALISVEQLDLAIGAFRGDPAELEAVDREIRRLTELLTDDLPCKAK
jgi:hypothetical protein